MAVARDSAGQEISEQFTLRANGRAVVVEASVDPETPRTRIAASVFATLGIEPGATGGADPLYAAAAAGRTYPCVVAWTDYESHGYRSLLSVGCGPGAARTVVGADFLDPHRLRIDPRHGGLVGWAPPNATPLTGGGYILDASPGEVLELNGMRFEAAQPGEVLRPHPAWRFTVPAGVKTRPASPDSAADDAMPDASGGTTDGDVRAYDAGRAPRKWICEWRGPVPIPLATLIASLRDAIATAAQHTRVDPACRLHGWRRELERLAQQDRRAVAAQTVQHLMENRTRLTENGESGGAGAALWEFPSRDAYRSLVEARMFVQVVTRLAPHLRPPDWAKLVSGRLRPEDEPEFRPHRDHLLELYVAAVADAAGMAAELAQGPDPRANPDVIIDVAGERVGIAVKRVGSAKSVPKHARAAARQIARAAVERGLVFLDVSNAMNRDAAAIRYLHRPEVLETHGSGTVLGHLLRFASEHPELEQLLEGPHVEGVVLRHAVPAMLAGSFVPASLETWSPTVEQPSDLTVAAFGRMLDALASSDVQQTVGPSGYAPCEVAYVHP